MEREKEESEIIRHSELTRSRQRGRKPRWMFRTCHQTVGRNAVITEKGSPHCDQVSSMALLRGESSYTALRIVPKLTTGLEGQ